MKGYLYIKEKSNITENDEIIQIIDEIKECKHDYTIENHHDISLYFYNNENEKLEMPVSDYTVAFSGLLTMNYKKLANNIGIRNISENINYISKLSGISSVSFLHKPSNAIYAFNGFSGVNPVFYCETESRIVVGTDPLVVNCVAYKTKKPIFDLSNISSFLMMGFFFSHETLFKNVRSIPFNHLITVNDQGYQISPMDNSLDTVFTKKPSKENYEDLADSFIESFDVVPKNKVPQLGLTGGKDSRLLVLGMQANKISFNAITRGHEDHPDVIIAKKLAEKLSINHKVNSNVPLGKESLSVDLSMKILKTMKGTSGQLFGYENISYHTDFKGNIGLNGVGAESIRGGFAATRSINSDVDKYQTLLKNYFPFKRLIKTEFTKKYEQELFKISNSPRSLKEIGNLLFLEYYNGNRTASARQALLYYSTPISPFFDNRFLKSALQFDIEEISNEKLQYNLMKTLNPKSVEVPLANSRWLFEKDRPSDSKSFHKWLKTEPVTPKSQRGGYNWRLFKNQDKIFIEAFKNLLLDNPYSKIYEVVDYEQVKRMFERENMQSLTRFLWSLLSVKLYTEYYEDKGQIISKPLELKLPSSIERDKFKPVVYNLTKDIYPLNNKVMIDSERSMISINQASDLNGYIIIGDGNLSKPVSKSYESNFKVRKQSTSITFQMCVDNLADDYLASMFILQFDEQGRRIKSVRYEIENIKLGEQIYGEKFKPESNADSIKIAFIVKSDSSNPIFEIKYAFIRHN